MSNFMVIKLKYQKLIHFTAHTTDKISIMSLLACFADLHPLIDIHIGLVISCLSTSLMLYTPIPITNTLSTRINNQLNQHLYTERILTQRNQNISRTSACIFLVRTDYSKRGTCCVVGCKGDSFAVPIVRIDRGLHRHCPFCLL